MLNLLIAVMGDSYGEIKANEEAAAMYGQAGTIVKYEHFLIHFGLWDAKSKVKFPRYMVIAEEAETEEKDVVIDKRVEALQEEMKRQHEETKQQHEETKRLLTAVMSRLGEHDAMSPGSVS